MCLCVGHNGRITDMTFNPAGKWLITSSMDSTVCTWDLLTGSLIDRTQVQQVSALCVSLSIIVYMTLTILATCKTCNYANYCY